MAGRIHSRELKLMVCRQIQSGEKRPAQVCREHSLADGLLHRWRQEFAERGEEAFTPRQPATPAETEVLERRIAELERHCGQLSLENALLKKLVEKVQSRSSMP
jgi:putative transposase